MDRNKIQLGARVRVDFTNFVGGEPAFQGELCKRPQDVGDTWGIRLGDGRLVEINSCSAGLESVCELSPSEKPQEKLPDGEILNWDEDGFTFRGELQDLGSGGSLFLPPVYLPPAFQGEAGEEVVIRVFRRK